jgi:glyoxylase-like metal-dependent hydrolase (beta-lactamase superfamily II)
VFRYQVGDVKITRVVESEGPTPGRLLFKEATPVAILAHSWLADHVATREGHLLMAVQALVIESCGQRIVVDTCVGNDKTRSNPAWNKLTGRFLDDMAEAGHPVNKVDAVVCTHLHVDHVGWNTVLDGDTWRPTFSNARYLFGRDEWAHWSASTGAEDVQVVGDSVRPVVDAGLVDLVETNHVLTDEVSLEPTLGHTPGHVSVRIRSRGEEAIITGDMTHHPVQCAEPDWSSRFDSDPQMARDTRRRCYAQWQAEETRIFGTHFATPTEGRIVSDGDAWRLAVGKR